MLFLVLAAVAFFAASGTVSIAEAADTVTGTNNATFVLSADGSVYTLSQDSHFEAFAVSASSIVFTLKGGSYVVLSSGSKRLLSNSLGIATTCGTDQSVLIISLGASAPSQTVTVTPGGVCPGSNGASAPQGGAPGVPSAVFVSFLTFGAYGQEVQKLQEFLITQGFLAEENAIGFFGPKTQEAVRQFQKTYSIVTAGTPSTTGFGAVGPKTRKELNELYAVSTLSESAKLELIENLKEQILLLQVKLLQLQLKK